MKIHIHISSHLCTSFYLVPVHLFLVLVRVLWIAIWTTVKSLKLGIKICILTENQLCRNEMWRAAHNHNYMCHICANGFLDSNFKQLLIKKNQVFTKLPKISHIHKNRIFKSIIGNRLGSCSYHINFVSEHVRIYFLFFASCEPLSQLEYLCLSGKRRGPITVSLIR